LIFGLAAAAKQRWIGRIERAGDVPAVERPTIPACLARVVALAADLNIREFEVPRSYLDEAAKQISGNASLDSGQLQVLAEAGVNAGHADLAYTASATGLERGGAREARFLLLRAQALPQQQFDRRALCAAAVVQLTRQNRDAELLERAANLLRGQLHSADLDLTPEEAAEVLRKEKAEPKFLARSGYGPDYRAILKEKLCDCPDCRRARGEEVEPDDDVDLDDIFNSIPIPRDMPKEIAQMLLEQSEQAVARGESPESFAARLFGSVGTEELKKKGRRR
jgi:hypothetical protein